MVPVCMPYEHRNFSYRNIPKLRCDCVDDDSDANADAVV